MLGTGLDEAVPVSETDPDQELWVEEVASRLGLPVAMLIRRIEAGVLPARGIPQESGVRYRVRAATFSLPAEAEPAAEAPPAFSLPADADPAAPAAPDAPPAFSIPAPSAPLVPAGAAENAEPRPPSGETTAAASPAPPGAHPLVGVVEARRDTLPEQARLVDGEALSTATLDAKELVAALLDRFERTLDQRLHAEYELRFTAHVAAQQRRIAELEAEVAARVHAAAQHAAALERTREEHAAALAVRDRRHQAATADVEALRVRADRLGERDAALDSIRREAATLQSDLAAARRAAHERERADADRERVLAIRDREVSEFRDRLAEAERATAQLRQEVSERDRALADVHAQLVRRDDELDTLRAARRRRGLFRR